MNKIINNGIFYVVISFVAVLAIGSVMAIAYSGNSQPKTQVINEAGGVININETQAPLAAAEATETDLGASTIQEANIEPSITLTGRFINGSTTVLSIVNPFKRATTSPNDVLIQGTGTTAATSTVDLVRLDIQKNATTSIGISCGAATAAGAAPTNEIITYAQANIATSTSGILENGLTKALGGVADGGTVTKIILNQTYPWLTCIATLGYGSTPITSAVNEFEGKYTVRIGAPDISTR